MTLAAVLDRYAAYERRALLLYRRLAERFGDQPDAARRWRAMSDAEAAHFTTLQLATDRVAMAGAAGAEAGDLARTLEGTEDRLRELEEAAARPGLTLAEAVGLAADWEELEIARVSRLIAALPAAVRSHVQSGLLGQLDAHHGDLRALARATGSPDLERRAASLRGAPDPAS